MRVKSTLLLVGVIVFIYSGSLLFRANQAERVAERYVEMALIEVAKPWNAAQLANMASWGFREKAKLKPSDIVNLANNSLGSLVKIIKKPQCNLQQGIDSYSNETHTYAVCEVEGEFEKTTAVMKIRLQDDGDWKDGQWKIHNFISIK